MDRLKSCRPLPGCDAARRDEIAMKVEELAKEFQEFAMQAAESPGETLGSQALLHNRILGDVVDVVIIDELTIEHRAENGGSEQADQGSDEENMLT